MFSLFRQIRFLFLAGALSISGLEGSARQQRVERSQETYLNKIRYYRYLQPDSAIFYVKEAMEKARKEGDSVSMAALLAQYGMIDDNAGRYKEARNKYLQAEIIYRKDQNETGLASILIRLGVVEQRKGNFDKSLDYFFKALKISEKNQHLLGMLEARIALSETYMGIDELEHAQENLTLALQINEQIPLSNFTLNMYIDLGKLYLRFRAYEKAIHYIDEGLKNSGRVEFNGLHISLLTLKAKVYQEKGEFQRAVVILREALAFSREIKNVIRELTCLLDLAHMYASKEPTRALDYYDEALKIAGQQRLFRQEISILNEMSAVYKARGNLLKALSLREKSHELAHEFYYKDMMRQITSLETAYDQEKSNAQLSELRLKNDHEKLAKNIWLLVSIAVFFLFLITYVFYRKMKDWNQSLQVVNRKLEESNETKDKFFSIIAHDIRSPMVSTIGILKLIKDKDISDPDREKMVGKLVQHSENSLEILDKLLKWGQMQIKGVRLNKTRFNPSSLVARNVRLLKETANGKGITLDVQLPSSMEVQADQDHFEFVIRNLLANAIKFTDQGGKVEIRAGVSGKGKVCFEVKDNGVGISQHRLSTIFELFAAGTKGTSSEEGTSLGLAICKEFVEANGGSIEVESEPGSGTSFSVTLAGQLKDMQEV